MQLLHWSKTRRYVSIVADIVIMAVVLVALALIRGFSSWLSWSTLTLCGSLLMGCVLLFLFTLGVNRRLWRYAEDADYLRLFLAYGLGLGLFSLIDVFLLEDLSSFMFMLAATSASLLGSFFVRLAYRYWLRHRSPKETAKTGDKRYLAIVGAGSAAVSLLEEIQNNARNPYTVWCLFDDDPHKIGQKIHNVPVRGPISRLPKILKDSPVYDVVLAIPTLSLERRREIIAMCGKLQCKFRIMPDATTIMERSGASVVSSLRDVRVEDLLSRTTVSFSPSELDGLVKGKTVLVTGGGGSIGSELCRQIAKAGVSRLVVFDICENESYMLRQELKHLLGEELPVEVEVGSIVEAGRVDKIFAKYRPQVVFHAAAHKHVPLMEECPCEAVRNNIFGTHNVLQAAHRYQVEKFVQISTDKAINPTNVMGATKRYCELMVRGMASVAGCGTDFVAVRFGNVLGSHGSVLPLFQMQIAHGGPVTITDKRITRYFMTIPEAAGLVIKAAAMAQRSEVFILDMGQPVKILELAENIIRLSGFEPYEEIAILETGLRPGEKLYEELLVDDNNHASTSVAKIFVERDTEEIDPEVIHGQLLQLEAAIKAGDDPGVLRLLHEFVPTFKTPAEVNGRFAQRQEELRRQITAEEQRAADIRRQMGDPATLEYKGA